MMVNRVKALIIKASYLLWVGRVICQNSQKMRFDRKVKNMHDAIKRWKHRVYCYSWQIICENQSIIYKK